MIFIATAGKGVDADAAAGHEASFHLDVARIHQRPEIVEDYVYAVLVEIAMIAEREEIELEALALHHTLARDIFDVDMAEVRLSGLGTKSGKFRAVESHHIFTVGMLVFKCFKQSRGVVSRINSALIAQQGHSFKFFFCTHDCKNFYGGLHFRAMECKVTNFLPVSQYIVTFVVMKSLSEYDSTRDGREAAPLVSVYVATYNQERYLRDCLDGILAQRTRFPVEVIVVDDASTDSNPQIIDEYSSRYPWVVKGVLLKRNYYSRGLSHFRDVFLKEARGKYVAFCEGDDYWTSPEKLSRQAGFLESHPDVSACFHNFAVKDESQSPGLSYFNRLRHSRYCSAEDIFLRQVMQTATVVARLSVFREDADFMADQNPEGLYVYDLRFYLVYYNAGKIYGFKDEWSVYRLHNSGVATSAHQQGSAKTRHRKILQHLGKCYQGRYGFIPGRWEKYDRMQSLLDGWTYARRRGEWGKALRNMCEAFRTAPGIFIRTYLRRYVY